MKKCIKYLWLIVLSVVTFGCEDFYKAPLVQDLDLDDIFSSEIVARSYLNEAYYGIQHYLPISSGDTADNGIYVRKSTYLRQSTIAQISDEGINCRTIGSYTYYVDDNQTPVRWNSDVAYLDNENYLFGYYFYMRKCVVYLENVANIPGASADFIAQTTAEAKALQAFMYYEMMKRYGAMPFLESSVSATDAIEGERPALADYVAYVDAMIAEAIVDLPESYSSTADAGKLTKGAAYFLRSRLWLYAASPLFNKTEADHTLLDSYGSGSYAGSHRGLEFLNYATSYSTEPWERAKTVTKEAIDYCASRYSLVQTAGASWDDAKEDYLTATTMLTDDRGISNTECVFFTRWLQTATLSSGWLAWRGVPFYSYLGMYITMANGGGQAPTQQQVNNYRMKDGSLLVEDPKDITNATLVNHYLTNTNPWENYEMRFHANTFYDELAVEVPGQNVTYQYDAVPDNDDYWASGYSMRKYIKDDWLYTAARANVKYDQVDINMRVPELYFNYAEILCELGGSAAEIYPWLKPTMERGLLDYDAIYATLPTDQDGIRQTIRREKAVEFAFEGGQRYWDTKRWLAADWLGDRKYGVRNDDSWAKAAWDDYGNLGTYPGVNGDGEHVFLGTKDADGNITTGALGSFTIGDNQRTTGYVFLPCSDARQYQSPNYKFPYRQFLWPIPSLEIRKDYGLVQNPGY